MEILNYLFRFSFKICFLTILLFSAKQSYSQIFVRDLPNEYYKDLINALSNPDSIYIYEVNSSWGSGIAYFISFKNLITKSGYYLNNNFISRILAPRGLMPVDSTNKFFEVIEESKMVNSEEITEAIKNIFFLPDNFNIKDTCEKDFIADGSNFQFSIITKDTSFYRSYYEIYEYAKLCPQLKKYKKLVEIDSLLKRCFPGSKEIIGNLLNEYESHKITNN